MASEVPLNHPPPYSLMRVSQPDPEHIDAVSLAVQFVPGISSLPPVSWGYSGPPCPPSIYVGAGDLSPSSYACPTSSLSKEHLSRFNFIFFNNYVFIFRDIFYIFSQTWF